MKRMLLLMLAVMLILGACVSNKAFNSQKVQVQSLETRQGSQESQLIMAQKDIMDSRGKLDAILLKLQGVDAQLSDLTSMQAQIDDSATSIASLRSEIDELKVYLNDVVEANKSIEEQLTNLTADSDETFDAYTDYLLEMKDEASAYATKSDLDALIDESTLLAATLDELTAEVQTLLISNDQTQPVSEAPEAGHQGMLLDIQTRLTDLESQLADAKNGINGKDSALRTDVDALKVRVDGVNNELKTLTGDLEQIIVKERAAAEERRTKEMNKQYQAALQEYYNRGYEKSIQLFEAFLTKYPDSTLAPNANYWIAENYYTAGVYAKALREFQNVVSRYPSHPKAWDAQLKVGMTYYLMDDNKSAYEELNLLKTQKPAYPEMRIVDKYLKLVQP